MSIAEKIIKLDDNIKYLKKINEKAIKNQITKTVTGSKLSLLDSADMAFKRLKIIGNDQQNTSPTPEAPEEIKTVEQDVNILVANEAQTDATENITYEEQNYIIPAQQEMLEDDYFDFDNEEEIHTWRKIILNGSEKITSGGTSSSYSRFNLVAPNSVKGSASYNPILSTHFRSNYGFSVNSIFLSGAYENSYSIMMKPMTLEQFKAFLLEQYENGTPVTIYYKLKTPERLTFTEQQKQVKSKIKKAYTYEGGTYITASSQKVDPILEVEYYIDVNSLTNTISE